MVLVFHVNTQLILLYELRIDTDAYMTLREEGLQSEVERELVALYVV